MPQDVPGLTPHLLQGSLFFVSQLTFHVFYLLFTFPTGVSSWWAGVRPTSMVLYSQSWLDE